MWTIGFLVTPTLFSELESRAQAGALAGTLFTTAAVAGIVCSIVVLALLAILEGRRLMRSWRGWCVAAMLVVTVIGQYMVTPRIQAAKAGDGDRAAAEFARWHAVSSSLFVVNSVLGMALVLAATPRAEPAP